MAFTLSAGVITQTGIDANPSGLGAIAGVTTINDASGQVLTYDIKSLRLVINGTLTIPDRYWIKSEGTTPLNVITVGATGRLIIDGRQTITRPEGNVVIYSLACGIIIRRPSGVPFTVRTIQFDSGSQFEQYGGILECSGAVRWISSTTSLATWKEATWYIFDRNNNQYMNVYFDLSKPSVDGFKLFSNNAVNPGFLKTLDAGYSIKGYECIGGLVSIGAIDGTTALVTLEGFIGGFSRFDFGVRVGGIVTNEGPVGGYDFINANIGNALVPATNATANQTTGRARHFVRFTPTFLDASTSVGIEGGVLYQKDANSGNRRLQNGVPNDKIYINTSGVGGEFDPILLLTKVWSGVGVNPMFQDDRLPINGYFWDYNQLGTPVNVTSSIGPQLPTLYAPEDSNVTLSRTAANALIGTKFTFDSVTKKITVTANATYDELYDANKAFKCTATQLNLETPTLNQLILTASGADLNAFNGWALEVASGVTLSQGVKFNKVKFNTVTILGTGAITGVYQDNTGTSTVLTISGFDANSAVYIQDQNAIEKFYSADATGTVTYYIPPTGIGSWYYAVEKYGNQRQSDFFTFNGGFRDIVVKAIPDTGLTVLNSATVGAYTQLENPDKVYDYVAFKRLSVPFISYGQIVFKDGTALDLVDADMVIDQSAAQVADFDFDDKILTVKSSSMVTGVTYNLIKTTPPKTIEAASTEVISVNIEDANGDSLIRINGGLAPFNIFKFPIATTDFPIGLIPDTRMDPVNFLESTNQRNYRFIADPDYNYFIFSPSGRSDSNIPVNFEGQTDWDVLVKGTYSAPLYKGDEIIIKEAPEITLINQKVDILVNDIDGIKGTGFTVNTDSLKNISDKVQSLENTDLTGIALEASVQEVLTAVENIEVDNAAIADAVWDEVLTGGTHNIGGSAGRRLRTLADTVILKEGVGTDMVNSGGTGLLTLEVGTTTQCIYQAIRVNDIVRFIREYNSATRVATMDKPWCEVTAGNVEYTLFNLRESTEGITVADIEASTILAKESTLEEIKTDIANIDVDLTGVALEATSQEILTGLGNIEVDKEAIAEEVWLQQPDRLKNVATIQTTGDQIATI